MSHRQILTLEYKNDTWNRTRKLHNICADCRYELSPEAPQPLSVDIDSSDWRIILAVVSIGIGIGNLIAAYSIIRFFRWRSKHDKRSD